MSRLGISTRIVARDWEEGEKGEWLLMNTRFLFEVMKYSEIKER